MRSTVTHLYFPPCLGYCCQNNKKKENYNNADKYYFEIKQIFHVSKVKRMALI